MGMRLVALALAGALLLGGAAYLSRAPSRTEVSAIELKPVRTVAESRPKRPALKKTRPSIAPKSAQRSRRSASLGAGAVSRPARPPAGAEARPRAARTRAPALQERVGAGASPVPAPPPAAAGDEASVEMDDSGNTHDSEGMDEGDDGDHVGDGDG
jgi:hypothetical protein